VAWLVGALVVLFVGACSATAAALLRNQQAQEQNSGSVTWFQDSSPAADFHLHDQFGRPIDLARLRGKAVALTFVSAGCTEDCPLIGHSLALIDRSLSAPDRQRVVYVAISVAPADGVPRGVIPDTPAAIAHFIDTAGLQAAARESRFLFLTGHYAALKPIWQAYGIGVVMPTPGPTADGQAPDVGHTAALYMIGTDGTLRAVSSFPFTNADIVQGLNHLLH
jgi:cytochrome oxidase Cu insertion factor (SCO1/SenC/PrrC family)